MNIPKVEFKIKKLDQYLDSFIYFLNIQKNGWDKGILLEYPQLKDQLRLKNNLNDRNKIVYDFFSRIEEKKGLELDLKKQTFQNSWNSINDKALRMLLKINEVEWPSSAGSIVGYITLNPICPVYIKENGFDLYYKFNINKMKTVALHEISHFIYFKKWKQVFPKISEKEYNGPGLVWELSEMMPAIILSDKRIQRIHKHTPTVYTEYKTLEVDNKLILNHLKEFYDNRSDFEDFLRNSWSFVKKYENEITRKLGRK